MDRGDGMSLRALRSQLVASAVCFGAVCAAPELAGAGSFDSGGDSAGGSTAEGSIKAMAESGGTASASTTSLGSAPSLPVCTWTLAYIESVAVEIGGVGAELGEVASFRDAETKQSVDAGGPGVEALYFVECPGSSGYRWAAPADYVDRQALIDAAYDQATAQVPLPSLNMSPAPEVGGVVNLGLWLAVDDPGQVNALAQAGPVWASVTARFVGMSWDMGTGDVVECDGLGSPYPEGSNQIVEGPCGYTYTAQPPQAGYSVTATGHWEVELSTSDGVDQMLGPIDMSYAFAYDVDEVVTVGEA